MRAQLLVSLCIALAACGGAPQTADSAATAASTATVNSQQQLEEIYAQYWQAALERNPLRATFIGDPRYNDRLPNTLSPAYRDASKAFAALWLERARAIDPEALAPRARVSYDVFVGNLEDELAGYAFRDDLMPLNQFRNMASTFAMLGAGTGAQPFRSVSDYDNWLARAGQIPALFDQAIANMRDGVAQGLTQPRVLIEKAIPQFDALIADDPEKTIFWKPIENLPADFAEADRTRLREAYRALIADTLMPAYRKLRAYAADEYLPATRDTVGIGALPNGEAWYAYLARQSTTTDLSPEQIHRIGLDEVARIHDEMRKVMTQTGFTDELKDYFTHLKADPANYFGSEQDMLDAYRGFRATIEPLLPALFDVRPKADFEIRPVEAFRAASAAGGSYQRPAQDGSRPGIFYANTFDLKARPRYALESLFLHEAEPGHHFQIALQQELTELPAFRRFGGETAFAEGWGLYAESLGKELGVYTDPVMYFGALDAELWRAIRLVVDTGIHAKGWSRQQVLDYMYANSPVEATRAIAEAERFMAIPGQALAYKIGQIRIRALRTKAEAALGEHFDVRAFHREVLNDGTVPMKVLEAKIDRWIAAQSP
jgi:uncharacterized protein (DUF885 family)